MAKITVSVDSLDFLTGMYSLDSRIEGFERHMNECACADKDYWTARIAKLRSARTNLEAAYDAAIGG